ncbi:RNase J family beta-CASP ribonuclease [Candidatus Woesearchaeota archaeon]|jgi:ribonuclease J|nr:RNase J family beta-CASP ribonuclease [Candidatus Woesearchaeota archaeon]MBT4368735.1 RNase J family beta-CASP ribonuclease [Candidatus Woesearchaeota archaeon]MBT4712024.1 RNase J family beta-CASP ribonuclease [Candidatus Woesearchaeota archaeon]MBT6638919.1 RNase J family beta-CASP ribonuclease [Candidatus Woesearchaeota archaeon]MBT7134563.1 RNase J family beta-CASP ribonuclease [Candidatus Woesearchaeota archaeon]
MIQIIAVSGFDYVGKNMTAIKVDDEVVICDMGIHLENYIKFTEDEDLINVSPEDLKRVEAIPNTKNIEDIKGQVKAIIPTHAHLDHVGAIPYLANEFNADIVCTPFTAEVIKTILRDEKIKINNNIRSIHPNSSFKVSENITIEFINVTHSTPQTAMVAIHTKYGTVLYANDFKFDLYPTLGKKPNFKRLEELENVVAVIVDSTYSRDERKMPSESVAKQMLKDIMLGSYSHEKAIIITTFSSHIARLNSIVQFSKKTGRKLLFLGRSLNKYIKAAEKVGIIDFSKDAEVIRFRGKIYNKLRTVMKEGKEKYILVVTGHQGEPKAILSRMANGETPFRFDSEDFVIFSCKTIPSPLTIEGRKVLEEKLKRTGIRMFKDIHVSGHAAKEDLKDLLLMVKPKNVIPAHGDESMKQGMREICLAMGYEEKQVHLLHDGESVKFN